MVWFFGMMLGTAGVGFRLFQGVSCLRHGGFIEQVDERSFFTDKVFRGVVYFARFVPVE